MQCIRIVTDEDIGLEKIPFNNPKIREASRGIVVNVDGKIALIYKTTKNEYKLPGGGLEENETPEVAFCREILEETGCEVLITEEIGTIEEHKSHADFKQISHIFVSKVLVNHETLNLTDKEKDEGTTLLWVDTNEALNLISNCYDYLKPSKYDDVYQTKFVIKRDSEILEYYIKNKNHRLA